MRRSSIPLSFRVLGVLLGLAVILGGLAARAIEEEYGPPSYTIEAAEGYAVAYDVDDMTALEVQELEGERARVYDTVDGTRRVVFEGSSEEAHAWVKDRTHTKVYEGTAAEVEAWMTEQRETGKELLVPNLVIAAGVVIVIAALALGWQRTGRPATPTSVRH